MTTLQVIAAGTLAHRDQFAHKARLNQYGTEVARTL
jgi:hypothetical protein